MINKKRSISPLIATILLIVVSVILISVVLTWGSDFARDKLSTAKNISTQNKDLTGLITSRSISSQNILISNNSSQDLNITGYKIISSIDHYLYDYFENKIYNLDQPLIINPNSAQILKIDCFPESSFFIDLITDQNIHVRTQILAKSITDVDSLKCGLLFEVDFRNNNIIDLVNGLNSTINANSSIIETDKGFALYGENTANTGIIYNHNLEFVNGTIIVAFNANSNSQYHNIFGITNSSGVRYQLYVTQTGEMYCFSNESYMRSAFNYSDDVWHIAVFSWNPTSKKLFVDGVQKALSSLTSISTSVANKIYIGDGPTTHGMKGYIGYKVMLLDRELMNSEIQKINSDFHDQ